MEIKKIPLNEMEQFVAIVSRSYPGIHIVSEDDHTKTAERFSEIQKNDQASSFYGAYKDGKMVGGMRLLDFEMMYHKKIVPIGGIGSVAVDLLHKKERVAKLMLEYFHEHYRDRGFPLTALYPFRPDFYKQMGYGYGTKKNRYRVKPENLPKGSSKAHIAYITLDQVDTLVDCYNRVAAKTHGYMLRTDKDYIRPMKQQGNYTIGYLKNGEVKGYAGFSFQSGKEGNFVINDILIHEFVYENQDVLTEMLTFFHSQFDQIRYILFDTQDEHFHYLFADPRNGTDEMIPHVTHESNTQGIGLMYRILDVKVFMESLSSHNFNDKTCRLKLSVRDTFLPKNNQSVTIHVEDGRLKVGSDLETDVEVQINVSELSSWLMGVVPFDRLYQYGLAKISDPNYVNVVSDLFHSRQKPECLNRF
ncbi:enhanced intracellular survival protein Eis [Alkalihalobacillus sp. AL-G]|uniref:GNAT family N-acetyltransferase n=1 Tax=Alkalihalobacillus sp. AL-G TaxID=2926399 RepID=UPI00272B715D|nr:GNAT family N-acetyltransferase [Alkalihalobacillus sp. AL-G]WLD93254.1 GNAT family N-acetyltransferase [Alkalihalobacillus sp. AL-G]